MKNLWRESHKNHWGDKVNGSGHFKTGFMKKYSDPDELGAPKEASDSKTAKSMVFIALHYISIDFLLVCRYLC